MRKGSHHKKESILKIGQSKKGCTSPNKGKKFTPEWRENLRRSHLGYKINDVEGQSNNPQYRNWQKRLNSYRRREAARLYGNPHTDEQWKKLKEDYDFTCPCCGRKEPEIKLTRDHIISLSKGGSDCIENIQPLCKQCNCSKHTKNIKYQFGIR